MNGLVTVLRREVVERWQVLPAALVAGLLPLILPLLLNGPAARSGELQVVMSLTAAGLLAALLAAGLGSNVLNGPLFSGRLSFYWTRPIGGWAVWAGTLGAAVLLALAAGSLALLPGVLLGRGGPLATLEVLREAASGSALLGEPKLPSSALVLGLVLTGALVLALGGHAAATLLRLRSWLLLDLVAALAIGLAVASAVDRLTSGEAWTALRLLGLGLAALLLVALLAATAAQVVIGRNDAVRGRRWLATILWTTLAAGAAIAHGYAAWVVSPTPADLSMAWGSAQSGGGRHAFVEGPVRGRGDYQAAFLADLESGSFTRIGTNLSRRSALFAFGSRCAVWITGTPQELWIAELTDSIVERAQDHRPLAISLPDGEVVASDDCRLLAVTDVNRLFLVETSTGRQVASVTLPGSRASGDSLAFSPDGETLRVLRTVPMLPGAVDDQHTFIEVWELRTDQPAAQPQRIARSDSASSHAFLLPGGDRVLARTQVVGGDRWLLTFPELQPIARVALDDGCQARVWPLADGRFAITERCGGNHTLRLLAADGGAFRSYSLPRSRQVRPGSQPAHDTLLLGAYAPEAVEPATPAGRSEQRDRFFWRTLLLNLRTGEISRVGDGLFPVFAGLGPENAGSRLLASAADGLLLFDPVSGEGRPLPTPD